MKKVLIFSILSIASVLFPCYSQETEKVDFSYTPDKVVEDRLDIPVDISVRIERINLTSRLKITDYPDGVKQSIADDLGTIFNNRVIEGGDVSIVVEVKALMFKFQRNFFLRVFLPFIGSTKFTGIAELNVVIYDSSTMNQILSYQISHSVFEQEKQALGEKYYDYFDRDYNIVYNALKGALNKAKTNIFNDREIIEEYWKTELSEIPPSLLIKPSLSTEVTDTLFLQFEKQYEEQPYIVDKRDGLVYGVTKIGTQFWIKENLKWLPVVHPPGYESNTKAAFYVYGYDGNDVSAAKETDNYKNYGVLYNWSAARIACPQGWHLPDDDDWQVLKAHLIQNYPDVNSSNVGDVLKSARQVRSGLGDEYATDEHPRWNRNRRNFGEDHFGFSAMPGGYRNFHTDEFMGLGKIGSWWSLTEFSLNKASGKNIVHSSGKLNPKPFETYKPTGLSVRCVLGQNSLGYYDNVQTLDSNFFKIITNNGLANDPIIVRPKEREKLDYLLLGVGFGLSYGGLGMQIERLFHNRMRIGVHAGIGYSPAFGYDSGSVFYTIGTKVFIAELNPYNIYINIQIGPLARYLPEEHKMVFHLGSLFFWHDPLGNEHNKDYYIYGPSVLFGYEVFSSGGLGFNAAVGAGITVTSRDSSSIGFGQVVPSIDLGVIYKVPIKTTNPSTAF